MTNLSHLVKAALILVSFPQSFSLQSIDNKTHLRVKSVESGSPSSGKVPYILPAERMCNIMLMRHMRRVQSCHQTMRLAFHVTQHLEWINETYPNERTNE